MCQAPSESSVDKLRLHKLCTSIELRLLLLRDCIKSHGQIQLHTRVLAKLCPHQGYIFVRITIVIATSRQDFFRGHFSTEISDIERIGHLAPGKPRNGVSGLVVKTKLLFTPESSNEICARVCALRQLIAMAKIRPMDLNACVTWPRA